MNFRRFLAGGSRSWGRPRVILARQASVGSVSLATEAGKPGRAAPLGGCPLFVFDRASLNAAQSKLPRGGAIGAGGSNEAIGVLFWRDMRKALPLAIAAIVLQLVLVIVKGVGL